MLERQKLTAGSHAGPGIFVPTQLLAITGTANELEQAQFMLLGPALVEANAWLICTAKQQSPTRCILD